MEFAPLFFLQLPVDIRHKVYYHLNGQLTQLRPSSQYELFTEPPSACSQTTAALDRGQKRMIRRLKKRLLSKFSQYIDVYSHSPNFVETWLRYSVWLRYDCITLDYLRLNHSFEGFLERMYWIPIAGSLQLALFGPRGLLQVWYTPQEFQQWVIGQSDNPELSLAYTDINLEAVPYDCLTQLYHLLASQGLQDYVNGIRFQQDEDTRDLSNPSVTCTISRLESFRNLQKLEVVGTGLFENIANFHGLRSNPGRTINYIVKKRVRDLTVERCPTVGFDSIADFTRWENLVVLNITHCQMLDLNRVLLPKHCQRLILSNINELTWWNQHELKGLAKDLIITRRESRNEKSDGVDHHGGDPPCSYPARQINVVDTTREANRDLLLKCKALVLDAYGSLNYIQLKDIVSIKGEIFVPSSLYYNKRLETFRNVASSSAITVI